MANILETSMMFLINRHNRKKLIIQIYFQNSYLQSFS